MRGGLGRAKAAGVQGAEKREGHHTEDGHSQRVPEVRAAAAARCKRAWRNTSSASDRAGSAQHERKRTGGAPRRRAVRGVRRARMDPCIYRVTSSAQSFSLPLPSLLEYVAKAQPSMLERVRLYVCYLTR